MDQFLVNGYPLHSSSKATAIHPQSSRWISLTNPLIQFSDSLVTKLLNMYNYLVTCDLENITILHACDSFTK